MTDPMRLYQEEARSHRPSVDLEKRTVELVQRLEREEGTRSIPERRPCFSSVKTSWKKGPFEGVLRHAALVAGIAIALFTGAYAVIRNDGVIVVGEASAIELEAESMFISNPRSSVLEIDGDLRSARVVLSADLSCANTGEAPVVIEANEGSSLLMRRRGESEWGDGVVLTGAGSERVEFSIPVSVDEADIDAFQTGSGLSDAAYARLIAQASQRLSTCFLVLQCEGFSVTEYALEPEFETDWRTVRRMVNAGDRLGFSLVPGRGFPGASSSE